MPFTSPPHPFWARDLPGPDRDEPREGAGRCILADPSNRKELQSHVRMPPPIQRYDREAEPGPGDRPPPSLSPSAGFVGQESGLGGVHAQFPSFWLLAWIWARQKLLRAAAKHKFHADRHHVLGPTYRPGSRVWLSTRNLRLQGPSRKLLLLSVGRFLSQRLLTLCQFSLV